MSAAALAGVFISYSSVDRQIVSAAARLLRAAGATVFQDITDLQFGDNWDQALQRAIAQCERVMVFWSAAAAQSAGVEREWRCALDAGKRIVPMSLDKTPLPPPLAALHGVPDLAEMLQSAMHLAAAEPSAKTAAQTMSTLPWRMIGITGAATAALIATLSAALAYGWWFLSNKPADFKRDLPPIVGPGVPDPPVWEQDLPIANWVYWGTIVIALVGAVIMWRSRQLARRRKELAPDSDTVTQPSADALSDAEDAGAWASLGTRFASALFNDGVGR